MAEVSSTVKRPNDSEIVAELVRMFRAPEWRSAADYCQEVAYTLETWGGYDLAHPDDCDGCGAWPADGCSAR